MPDLMTFLAQHPLLSIAAVIVIVLIFIVELLRSQRGTINISPAKVTQLINKNHAVIIDLRQQEAFRQGHIIDAQLRAAQDIQKNPKTLEKFKNRPIVLVANSSHESQKIAALLLKQGYNAYSLAGGIKAWNEAQMPLVKEL